MSTDLAQNPSFSSLARHGAELYASQKVFLARNTLVIFTCGAAHGNTHSAREDLLKYAERYFQHGTLFRAEDVFPVLVGSRRVDLLTIENKLADYSDCVLIINESAGTLAELGAFANDDHIVKKLLVVNPKQHQRGDSFITLGPIARANKKSRFEDTIYVDLRSASVHFDYILDRIAKHAGRKRRLGVDFSTEGAWKNKQGKLKLLLIQDLLNLYSPVSRKEMFAVLRKLFPKEFVHFDVELGLLIATKRLSQSGDYFFTTRVCFDHSYEVDIAKWLGARKKILDFYRSKDTQRLLLLSERSRGAR